MSTWVIWIALAGALAAGEVATMGFLLAPLAFGAVIAAAAAAAGGSLSLEVIVFVIVSALSFLLVRPIARAHRRGPPGTLRTDAPALVGRRGVVVERIANDEGLGVVRIDGEVWTARAYDRDAEFEAGARVAVLEIRGATALVASQRRR